ncbi:aldo/keto reductase [Thioclava marina]|uniref:aldo/keto reductase n=1 Tax=Thioclava marina TaxID=1915077 RepID=UPI0023526623|nr:aldo/keto reductase [Thioclava marina]
MRLLALLALALYMARKANHMADRSIPEEPMPQITLNRRSLGIGPEVSELCLGTMMFGAQTEPAMAEDMIARFAEAGGRFIDTADVYADGRSEEIVGRAIAARRDDWFLATKVGNKLAGQPDSGGLSGRWIAEGLKRSLDRLGTEVIDLYYLHRDDETTPLEEVIEALGLTLEDGKIRHWGFSNFRAWKIAEMIRIADRLGVARPLAAQPYYHALYRLAEIDYLPACAHFGIGIVPYSPLARGVLTGKYVGGIPEGSRAARGDRRITETEFRPDLLAAAERVDAHARASGRRTADLAVRWVLENRIVSSVLIGPKSPEQLEAYLSGPGTDYTAEDETFIEGIVPVGAVVGNYADPAYPFRGRVTPLRDA